MDQRCIHQQTMSLLDATYINYGTTNLLRVTTSFFATPIITSVASASLHFIQPALTRILLTLSDNKRQETDRGCKRVIMYPWHLYCFHLQLLTTCCYKLQHQWRDLMCSSTPPLRETKPVTKKPEIPWNAPLKSFHNFCGSHRKTRYSCALHGFGNWQESRIHYRANCSHDLIPTLMFVRPNEIEVPWGSALHHKVSV